MGQTIAIAGLSVDNITREDAKTGINDLIASGKRHFICFVNAEAVTLSHHNKKFKKVLTEASMRLVDGVGMKIAALAQGKRFTENCNGTDLFPHLCKLARDHKLRVFLLGGRLEVVRNTADWMRNEYPQVNVVGCGSGYFTNNEETEIIASIAALKPDILLVGLGSPYQEIWIYDHLDQLGAKVAMGVGGLFDFYSGLILRAPEWMRLMGLEWVWRIAREPKRWLRLLRLFEFVYIVLILNRVK